MPIRAYRVGTDDPLRAEQLPSRGTARYARNGFLRADQKAGVPPAIVTVEPDW